MTFSPWVSAIAKRMPSGIACLLLIACSSPAPSSNDAEGGRDQASGDRLQVVTTFLPITQFTKAVAGSCADVVQLLPSNVGPHDYQAKPTDAQRLLQADVLVQNGLELEQFLEPMIEGTGRESLMMIETSTGLALRPSSSGREEHGHEDHGDEHEGEHHGEAHDEHGHDDAHGHNDDHGHDEEHGHDDDHDSEATSAKAEGHDHDHGEYDPHVWLDPVLAVEQVNNIRDGLVGAAPDCEAEFTANAAEFSAQLQELDQEIQSALAPYAGKTFVTYHDFAGYFSDRYQLNVESLVGVPEVSPSPSDIQRVMAAVEASELKTLLVESEASAKPFEALAQDLDVSISSFSSNELGESNEPEAYLAVMRENVASLQAAFAEE